VISALNPKAAFAEARDRHSVTKYWADMAVPRLGIEASKWKFRLNDIASKNPVPGHGGARLEQKSGRISISGDPLSPSKR
jgi:hypothetical protein